MASSWEKKSRDPTSRLRYGGGACVCESGCRLLIFSVLRAFSRYLRRLGVGAGWRERGGGEGWMEGRKEREGEGEAV